MPKGSSALVLFTRVYEVPNVAVMIQSFIVTHLSCMHLTARVDFVLFRLPIYAGSCFQLGLYEFCG